MILLLLACQPDPKDTASCEPIAETYPDDPSAWDSTPQGWTPTLSEPQFIIPGDGLPVSPQAANNNVAITLAGDRIFVAWRTAPTHFASTETELHVISATSPEGPWDLEASFVMGADLREPAFLIWETKLSLSFFEAGTNPGAFEPHAVWHATRCHTGEWNATPISEGEKVPWDIKVRDNLALRTAYSGDHYGDGQLSVHLERSQDGGQSWSPLGKDPVSTGGDSEVAFEIAADGSLWAVTRNEDGDTTGAGSKICTAPASDWSDWSCPEVSDVERYDSPELIRHGQDLYLLARRDVGGPFGPEGDLVGYSARAKRSALYWIDQDARKVVWVQDIPGVGDTAFVSAWRSGAHSWLFANYTSPLDEPDVSWLQGQTSARGTQIYLAELTFEAP